MSKLVLLLEDGSTQDILLKRERITIGRRPDNDICLPHPAVSGEHAAVTTILSDSFLEDLESTNGTLVNGKRIQKHCLRDGDRVDVGPQRLVYLVDERAMPPAELTRRAALPPQALHAAAQAHAATITDPGATGLADWSDRAEAAPVDAHAAIAPTRVSAPNGHGVGLIVDDAPLRSAGNGRSEGEEGPELVVLTGPRAGRSLALVKDVTSVGRAGVQVALIRRTAEGYLLTKAEGSPPPELNGLIVPEPGTLLGPGDVIQVAGTRIEFCPPPDLPT